MWRGFRFIGDSGIMDSGLAGFARAPE